MGLILVITCVIFAAMLGSSKGYSGVLCGVAGFFGGLIAIVVIALLPNRVEEQEEAARRESARNDEITELKKRIRDLEAAQQSAPPPSTEDSKADDIGTDVQS